MSECMALDALSDNEFPGMQHRAGLQRMSGDLKLTACGGGDRGVMV